MPDLTLICPDHGRVYARLAWCRVDRRLHLGGRCPHCGLWLRWLPPDMKGAPPVARIEALG